MPTSSKKATVISIIPNLMQEQMTRFDKDKNVLMKDEKDEKFEKNEMVEKNEYEEKKEKDIYKEVPSKK